MAEQRVERKPPLPMRATYRFRVRSSSIRTRASGVIGGTGLAVGAGVGGIDIEVMRL